MPSKSEEQRRLMCLAYQMKIGKTPRSASAQAAELADSMSEEELREYCKSKVKQ